MFNSVVLILFMLVGRIEFPQEYMKLVRSIPAHRLLLYAEYIVLTQKSDAIVSWIGSKYHNPNRFAYGMLFCMALLSLSEYRTSYCKELP